MSNTVKIVAVIIAIVIIVGLVWWKVSKSSSSTETAKKPDTAPATTAELAAPPATGGLSKADLEAHDRELIEKLKKEGLIKTAPAVTEEPVADETKVAVAKVTPLTTAAEKESAELWDLYKDASGKLWVNSDTKGWVIVPKGTKLSSEATTGGAEIVFLTGAPTWKWQATGKKKAPKK